MWQMLAICMELLCHVISQLPQPRKQNEWIGCLDQLGLQAVGTWGEMCDGGTCGRMEASRARCSQEVKKENISPYSCNEEGN